MVKLADVGVDPVLDQIRDRFVVLFDRQRVTVAVKPDVRYTAMSPGSERTSLAPRVEFGVRNCRSPLT